MMIQLRIKRLLEEVIDQDYDNDDRLNCHIMMRMIDLIPDQVWEEALGKVVKELQEGFGDKEEKEEQ